MENIGWINLSLISSLCFTTCNISISEITTEIGLYCIFYFSSGALLAGLAYHISTGKYLGQNLRENGQFKKRNLIKYIIYCCIYFIVQNLCYFTMYFANRADINIGVIITIWSLEPIFNQIADYYINSEKIHYYHIIGLISILLCSAAVCFKETP